jgi:hypothetical protein
MDLVETQVVRIEALVNLFFEQVDQVGRQVVVQSAVRRALVQIITQKFKTTDTLEASEILVEQIEQVFADQIDLAVDELVDQ